MYLAGDVGGTKVRLGLFEGNKCIHEEKLQSHDFPDFNSLLKKFLWDQSKLNVEGACFGIAGPIRDGVCKATNLPWVISAADLKEEFKIPKVSLINDLEANAWGIPALKPEELHVVNAGKQRAGNQVLISAGTGLGEAGLVWNGKRNVAFATEGGHCDFGPRTQEEIELLQFLMKEYDHVSYERLLSGSGLYNIYRFVVNTKRETTDPEVDTFLRDQEPQRLITDRANEKKCKACEYAIRLFLSIYGAEASNLALKYFAIGGVYIGGGIAPHLLSFFQQDHFMKGFTGKGRFAEMLSEIPIQVILNEKTALLGAAIYAQQGS